MGKRRWWVYLALTALLGGSVGVFAALSETREASLSQAAAQRNRVASPSRLEIWAGPGLRFSVAGRFPPPPLRVRVGQEVRIVVVNRDMLQHDLWVVKADDRAPYLVPAFPGARTPLLDPQARYELRFVPNAPGRYLYVCTVPGHDALMRGELVVEESR